MHIDGNLPIDEKKLFNKVQESNKDKTVDKKDGSQKTESDKDKVSLSGAAKEINDLKGIIRDIPDIRVDKVEALKKAIDTGTYTYDSSKIAQRIMQEEM